MRILSKVLSILLVSLTIQSCAQDQRPNIILIVVDDMRHDEWGGGGHPYLQTPAIDQLAQKGTRFSRAYHAVPLCSPNRASLLTGQYPSRHGIIDNTSRNQASFMLDLFPKYLQEAGYRTAHVGKWHMGNSPEPRPGYDFWVSMEGQGKTNNPILWQDGDFFEAEGYITDVFTEKALEFIQEPSEKPFFLYIGHKAIHPEAVQHDDGTIDLSVPKKFIAAERHKGKYAGKTMKRAPSHSSTFQADDGKPVVQRAFKTREKVRKEDPLWEAALDLGVSDETIQNRAEMMLAVDESLGTIVAALQELSMDNNTVIMFTSDNGYFYGEHGFSLERRMPYEESIKTPLIVYDPTMSNQENEVSELVVSVDLAATAVDIAGLDKPSTIQGHSLMPLISGNLDSARESALIEFYSNENPFPWTAQMDYRVVMTERFKYIKWLRFDEAELYDLENDPFEQNNLAKDPSYRDTVEEMKKRLRQLQIEALGLEK